MSIYEEVYAMIHEHLFHVSTDSLSIPIAVAVAGAINGAMALHNNPGYILAIVVCSLKVPFQPFEERLLCGLAVGDAEPQLCWDGHVMHQSIVPTEVQDVGCLAVGGREGCRLGIGWLRSEALHVVGEALRSILVIAVVDHVGHLRRKLLNVLHELIAGPAVICVQVIAKVTKVQKHVGLANFAHKSGACVSRTDRRITDFSV
mmetsp:Transcript_21832/g.41672  ORF Transcript_21832/g.41672 Transcript_21832/m.41672 type:complete len:203 (-) Transcript_21832:47-655(-)